MKILKNKSEVLFGHTRMKNKAIKSSALKSKLTHETLLFDKFDLKIIITRTKSTKCMKHKTKANKNQN